MFETNTELVMRAGLLLMSAMLLVVQPAVAKNTAEAITADAVIAADEAWSAAEERGDSAFVAWLLEPGYVSVGSDGRINDRDAIVANAATRKPGDQVAAAKDAAWRAAHPYRTTVKIFGDTAVASFLSIKPGSGEPVNSSDVFVYRDGHWHAIYSQHSSAGG